VRALDGGVLHGVDHAERRHQLAGGMRGDRQPAAEAAVDLLGEELGAAEQRSSDFGKLDARAPADLRLPIHSGAADCRAQWLPRRSRRCG